MTSKNSRLASRNLAKVCGAPRPSQGRPWVRRSRLMRVPSLRRVGRIALSLLVLAPLAYGIHWMHCSNVMDELVANGEREVRRLMLMSGLTLREIVVTGRRDTSPADFARALAAKQGDHLFDVEPQAARQRIEALGWVRSASVRRQFPDTLVVSIVERRPFALWQRSGRVSLIDREGEVISALNLDRFNHLPVIVGQGAPKHVGALVSILARQPTLFGQIEAATRVSERRWDIRLLGGLDISLPEHGVAEAWDLLASLARDHRLLDRDIVAIDLRVKDRLAVRLGPARAALRRGEGRNT